MLFLIERNLGQNRRLDQVFGFFHFFSGVYGLSTWIDQSGRHKNDQVSLDVLFDVGAKKAAENGNVADDRRAIFGLLHVLSHQTAQHDRLPVPYAHTRRYLPSTKDRLINNVWSYHAGW